LNHSFDVDLACEVGVNSALILSHIAFWVQKNEANGKHLHDGRFWTYSKASAFVEIFPYMTEKQVRKCLTDLLDNGYIEKGNYNKINYDRTLWYTLTEKGFAAVNYKRANATSQKGKSNLPNGEIEFTEKEIGISEKGTPIPDINKDNNKSNNKKDILPAKIHYSTFVTLTEEEHQKLIDKHGETGTAEIIEILDSYKEANGKKYASDAGAIRSWVADEWQKRKATMPQKKQEEPKKQVEEELDFMDQLEIYKQQKIEEAKRNGTYIDDGSDINF